MPTLLVVGGGLFGSMAAAWARRHGIDAIVFDAGRPGAASPAAAGLFQPAWAGRKHAHHYEYALPLLTQLYDIQSVALTHDDGRVEQVSCIPPAAILEPAPRSEPVTAIGAGWLEAGGVRHHGWVYVAAGIWCGDLLSGLGVYGKAGTALSFTGERPGRVRALGPGRQAMAFVRDHGFTYFSDGTAERSYTAEHDRLTSAHAHDLGLTDAPVERRCGWRPYAPGGPLFRRVANHTWVGTGGRKLGNIIGASFARRLLEEMQRTERERE